jgi:excisionase family DNA binding protein
MSEHGTGIALTGTRENLHERRLQQRRIWRLLAGAPAQDDPAAFSLILETCRAFMQLPAPTLREALAGFQSAGSVESEADPLAEVLSGGRRFSREEQATLHAATLAKAFAYRRDLLRDSLSASDVARLLGTSRQTPLDRVHAGSLLALRDGNSWRFPAWQFDPQGPDGAVAGLTEVLRALDVSPFAQASWLTRPNDQLGGKTPLAALQAGDRDRVVQLAARVEAA